MKILSRGTNPKDYMWEGTCGNCNTKFECQQHEGRIEYPRDQRDTAFLRVICPVCGKSANAYRTNRSVPHTEDRTNWPTRGPDLTWSSNVGRQIDAIEKYGVIER